jgi:hypothetical protein
MPMHGAKKIYVQGKASGATDNAVDATHRAQRRLVIVDPVLYARRCEDSFAVEAGTVIARLYLSTMID